MEKTKFHFTHTLTCKIICFILIAVVTVTALGGTVLCVFGVGEGWFDYEPNSFYESSLARNLVLDHLFEIMEAWRYQTVISEPEYKNLLYVIYDDEGRALLQNCDGEAAHFVSEESYSYWSGERQFDYTVKFWLRHPLEEGDEFFPAMRTYQWAKGNCYGILTAAVASYLVLILCFVLLLCGAGRRSGTEGVCLAWVNRKLPFDLYLAAMIAAFILPVVGFGLSLDYLYYAQRQSVVTLLTVCAALCVSAGAVVFTHTAVCFAARAKAGSWWRNTLCFRLCSFCFRCAKRLFGRSAGVFRALPLVWKSSLAFVAAMCINSFLAALAVHHFLAFLLLVMYDLAILAVVIFAAMQMKTLQKGGQALAAGNVDHKIDTQGMYWEFRRHAESLNSVSDGMYRAVNERMKSERFKTELITNVSHDIKTPLTSIISYVDLLKKEELENEKAAEYLEVIDRQSARLKKLTEDLVEASKASSGAVRLDLERVDISELLRQSVGEYSRRLTDAGITPILNMPEFALPVMADGRQIWRIFENLLSNIYKYAMPGTRAYITAEGVYGGVFVTFRNISASELNISADELMERFVRGDSSRSSEGSGLGLSIARSLAELMGGCFELFLDGDLFKAVVSFPMLREEN